MSLLPDVGDIEKKLETAEDHGAAVLEAALDRFLERLKKLRIVVTVEEKES